MAGENNYKKNVQFDGTNWNSWKYRISVLLEEKCLLDYIKTDITAILAAAEAADRDGHKKK